MPYLLAHSGVTIFDTNGDVLPSSQYAAVHLYTGRSMIAGTGLYDYRWRVMDPWTGRFNQRDPLWYIDSMNANAYVVSSPFVWIDPDGQSLRGRLLRVVVYSNPISAPYIGAYDTGRALGNGVKKLKDGHYDRNENQDVESLTIDDVTQDGSGWEEVTDPAQKIYHGLENRKFIRGKEEVVFAPDGSVVTDPALLGTYNFCNANVMFGAPHLVVDVLPYHIWGNAPEDPTDFGDRLGMTMEAIRIAATR